MMVFRFRSHFHLEALNVDVEVDVGRQLAVLSRCGREINSIPLRLASGGGWEADCKDDQELTEIATVILRAINQEPPRG